MNMTIAGEKISMDRIFYFAAWTDSGCLLGCFHEHATPSEAAVCIDSAGGYVVAVENGVLRALTAEEESQFQSAVDASKKDKSEAVEPDLLAHAVYQAGTGLHRLRGETLVEFVLRFPGRDKTSNLTARLDSAPSSAQLDRQALVVLISLIDLVRDWLNGWEVSELERIHAKNVPGWLETLRDRARRALEREVVG